MRIGFLTTKDQDTLCFFRHTGCLVVQGDTLTTLILNLPRIGQDLCVRKTHSRLPLEIQLDVIAALSGGSQLYR